MLSEIRLFQAESEVSSYLSGGGLLAQQSTQSGELAVGFGWRQALANQRLSREEEGHVQGSAPPFELPGNQSPGQVCGIFPWWTTASFQRTPMANMRLSHSNASPSEEKHPTHWRRSGISWVRTTTCSGWCCSMFEP